jgi:protein-S-isoprenylcysteine O-methyltransferase Ste14
MDVALVIRTLGLMVPAVATLLLIAFRPPGRREAAALLLSFLWNLPALLLMHFLASVFGWWRFQAQGGMLHGFPVDLYLGWALLWGPIAAVLFRHVSMITAISCMALVDLCLMPSSAPVIRLGESWLTGEILSLAVCLLPAQLLARWTTEERHLAGRAALQLVAFSGLTLGLLPAAALQSTATVLPRFSGIEGLLAQVLALPAIIGITAVQEFVERGRGTPFPYDPPHRLVTSGIYSYLRNPMQVSMVTLLTGLGLLLHNVWIAAAGLASIAYSAGLAMWHENSEVHARFGDAWRRYQKGVRPWLPRWRPWKTEAARLYVADGCGQCRQLREWLSKRSPVGLQIIPAESHPARDLERVTYDPSDGGPEEEGIAAVGRSLEHIHLGWATAGFMIRLPIVRAFLQLVADAVGFGPQRVSRCALFELPRNEQRVVRSQKPE